MAESLAFPPRHFASQSMNYILQIMRNLLGTHLGHSALYTMCRILQDTSSQHDVHLLRGAVFYVNMALWGTKRVTTLKYTATSVLPSFLAVLSSNNSIVMYEVMLSIQRLVNKFGLELKDPAWDLVLSIMEAIIEHIDVSDHAHVKNCEPLINTHLAVKTFLVRLRRAHWITSRRFCLPKDHKKKRSNTPPRSSPASQVTSTLHDTICTIEQLMELGQFHGSVRRVFELIERCSPVRPEASVLRLITFLSSNIIPIRSDWIQRLHSLVDKYFKQETRTTIRVRALDVLSNVISLNRPAYEDELIELIVIPQLQHIESDPDILVRTVAAQLLVHLALECENKRCLELLDILDKLLNRPLEQQGDVPITSEQDVADVKTVVVGLINIFTSKLFQLPSSHAIKAYKLLVGHLEAHYLKPAVFELVSSTRYLIFECFLRLRANSLYGLGYPDSVTGQVRFSPYLLVDHKEGERTGGGGSSPPPMSPAPTTYPTCTVTQLSLIQACKLVIACLRQERGELDTLQERGELDTLSLPSLVIACLRQERDWKVLSLILQEVPQVMKNKALILSHHSNEIDLLASALCAMVSDKSLGLPESLQNTPPKFTRSEFHTFVLPVLASLASYHGYLDPGHQQRLIKCLEFGLVSRCSRQCVMALTICALEMKDAMYKLLPEVLLNLSKISATVHIAIPLLEFLSTLTRLPKVFASFVGDQYMSVFAISLPYTNPFKYNHYTVSLAHHVIAVWFLKCRLPFRRDFVKFITTGLKANVIVPFEEGQLIMKSDLINEDSSSRKRSSSLTEQGSRRSLRTVGVRPEGRPGDLKPPIDEALMNFHMELTETCIDLMARYTFSTCSAQPKRLPTAEFLLSGGQSMTWILGNRVITVTTSGCSQKVLKNGLCDKCWMLCRPDKESVSPDVLADQEPQSGKQLQKSTNQRPVSNDEILLELVSILAQAMKLSVASYLSSLHYNLAFASYLSSLHSNLAFASYLSSLHSNLAFAPYLSSLHSNLAFASYLSSLHSNLAFAPNPFPTINKISSSRKAGSAEQCCDRYHLQVGPGSKDSRSFVTPDSSIISAPVEDIRKTLAAPDTHEPEPHRLEQIVFGSNEPEKQERQFCACWCQGWAEIHIRRPTGDVSWAMRIQNQCYYQSSPLDFPLADITTLFMPSLAGKKEDLMSSHKRINSETLAESEYDVSRTSH
uniref:Tuberin n=1 Tax=Timema monikensis TaxID=170555 RepID=A0A7R9EEA7_9NEOP|nr:unnamed protein product [Timema monikensis]